MNSETHNSLLESIEDSRVAYIFDSFRLVPSEYRLERKDAGPETLRPTELCVLLVLVRKSKRLVRRKEIFEAVWPGQNSVEEGTLNTQIKLLREILGDDANNPRFIETLPRRGFKFLPEVHEEWLDAESEAKAQLGEQAIAKLQKGIPVYGKTQLVGSLWIVDVTGEWHAIWETTAHHKVNINHEVVDFSQEGANITLKNREASPDNIDGGYLWEARLTLHDNRHMVGAYWSVDRSVNARGTLYLVVNTTGRFVTGVWAGCNIDRDLACGRVAFGKSRRDAEGEFSRFTAQPADKAKGKRAGIFPLDHKGKTHE